MIFLGIRRMPLHGAVAVVEATFDMEPSIASVMERADTTTLATFDMESSTASVMERAEIITPATLLLLFDIQKQVLTFVWYCTIITTIE